MKRSTWIFFLAVILPSIGLGWLALRSANEQQIILERRTAELYQKETDAVASAARSLIEDERRAFAGYAGAVGTGTSRPKGSTVSPACSMAAAGIETRSGAAV